MPEAVTIRPATCQARTLHAQDVLLAGKPAPVAQTEGTVVGMCSGQLTISTAEGGPAALMEDVVVRRGRRDRGIGRQLVNIIATWAAAHGATRLQLLADRSNETAIDFYKHTGWTTTRLTCLRRQVI